MKLTIRQTFTIILFLGLFVMTIFPIADPDFWWHLRTGQLIAQTHSIPHVDPYSFTNNGKPWVAHEWLSELIIYGLFFIGSYSLLSFVFSLIITTAFLLTLLRTPSGSRPYIAGFVILLGSIATAPTWGVRPQMISLLITSIFLLLLDRFLSTEKIAFILPLPLITLLWVNLHAGYFLGLVIILLYIGGLTVEIIYARFRNSNKVNPQSVRVLLSLCVILLLCILASLVNPNGYHILLYPFQTLSSPAMQQFIIEWFSPDFHQLQWQPLALFFLAFIVVGMLSSKTVSPIKIFLSLLFGYAALRSMRNVPLFVVVTAPILTEQIDSLVKIKSADKAPNLFLKWVNLIFLICLTLIVGFRFIQVNQAQSKTEGEKFPQSAVNWIEQNKPKGNLFNSYNWGGYLIWKLYPDYQVYIDGRADVYGDSFIFQYLEIYRSQPGWEQALASKSINLVLVEPRSGIANALKQSSKWIIAYEDSISVVFERK